VKKTRWLIDLTESKESQAELGNDHETSKVASGFRLIFEPLSKCATVASHPQKMPGRRRPREPSPPAPPSGSSASSSSSSSSSEDEDDQRLKSKRTRTKSERTSSSGRTSTNSRSLPNMLVTGTPGTGKSTLAERLQKEVPGLRWLNVGDFARRQGHLGDWDEERQCHELEEDPLLDDLEPQVAAGGLIVDYHVTDFFPERFFDVVFVLRTDNTSLHDRLKARGYSDAKVKENLECEIFQTVLDEARESYPEEMVHELRSDSEDQLEDNLGRIKMWIDAWKKDNCVVNETK
jgi:adenylate kinase